MSYAIVVVRGACIYIILSFLSRRNRLFNVYKTIVIAIYVIRDGDSKRFWPIDSACQRHRLSNQLNAFRPTFFFKTNTVVFLPLFRQRQHLSNVFSRQAYFFNYGNEMRSFIFCSFSKSIFDDKTIFSDTRHRIRKITTRTMITRLKTFSDVCGAFTTRDISADESRVHVSRGVRKNHTVLTSKRLRRVDQNKTKIKIVGRIVFFPPTTYRTIRESQKQVQRKARLSC